MKTVPVSVIIPCFNCMDTIERAVDSVFGQTCRPLEIILVNDGSDDETSGKLEEIKRAHHDRVKLFSLIQNRGPSVARNFAWEKASGNFLAFLDADDSWHPRKIEIQYAWMNRHRRAAISGHLCARLDGNTADETLPEKWRAYRVRPVVLLFSNCLQTRSVMVKRAMPYRFNEDKRHSEDYLLWLETVLNGFGAWYIDLPLAYSYKAPAGKAGLSGNLWQMEKGELDTYKRLCQRGLLPFFGLLLLVPFSLLKHFLRVLKRK